MSFRSSAVLTTTPFWSGISWTSQPMASQRGGLPPAPTRILLDSRYKSCSYLSKTLWNVVLVSSRPLCDCWLFCSPSPTGGATSLTFFWKSPGLIGWCCIHHRTEPISSSFILVISLSTLPRPPPAPRLFWRTLELVPVACQWLAPTHIYTQRSTPTMIPNSSNDTIVPERLPTAYLCFVKYSNDSINIEIM